MGKREPARAYLASSDADGLHLFMSPSPPPRVIQVPPLEAQVRWYVSCRLNMLSLPTTRQGVPLVCPTSGSGSCGGGRLERCLTQRRLRVSKRQPARRKQQSERVWVSIPFLYGSRRQQAELYHWHGSSPAGTQPFELQWAWRKWYRSHDNVAATARQCRLCTTWPLSAVHKWLPSFVWAHSA